jgi:hypothetical protein
VAELACAQQFVFVKEAEGIASIHPQVWRWANANLTTIECYGRVEVITETNSIINCCCSTNTRKFFLVKTEILGL